MRRLRQVAHVPRVSSHNMYEYTRSGPSLQQGQCSKSSTCFRTTFDWLAVKKMYEIIQSVYSKRVDLKTCTNSTGFCATFESLRFSAAERQCVRLGRRLQMYEKSDPLIRSEVDSNVAQKPVPAGGTRRERWEQIKHDDCAVTSRRYSLARVNFCVRTPQISRRAWDAENARDRTALGAECRHRNDFR